MDTGDSHSQPQMFEIKASLIDDWPLLYFQPVICVPEICLNLNYWLGQGPNQKISWFRFELQPFKLEKNLTSAVVWLLILQLKQQR